MRAWCIAFCALGCASAGSAADAGGQAPDAPAAADGAGEPDAPSFDAPPGPPDAAPPDAAILLPPDAAILPPDAMAPVCGDGVVAGGEQCDDGNGIDTDGCRSSCAWARCGDGVVRTGVEECDDGNTTDGDGCSPVCLTCSAGDARFTWAANNHCYSRVNAAVDFTSARAGCGWGHPVTYELGAENDAVAAALVNGTGASYWVGFTDEVVEGAFGWISGDPVVYTSWNTGEPNDAGGEDCTEQFDPGPWNDLACTTPRGTLCEDDGWHIDAFTNHAYRLVFTAAPQAAAVSACAALGGHLATITSAAEQAFVSARVHTNLWIGAGDAAVEGTFAWVTGEAFAYTAWGGGEPNDFMGAEDCAEIRGDATWNDENCLSPRGYVCEVD